VRLDHLLSKEHCHRLPCGGVGADPFTQADVLRVGLLIGCGALAIQTGCLLPAASTAQVPSGVPGVGTCAGGVGWSGRTVGS
jgi:hypothetical protein